MCRRPPRRFCTLELATMSRNPINIQDGYLFQALKENQELVVDLLNGTRLEGRLRRFDRFAVVVEHGGREVLVYKHAIATLRPA